MTTQQTHPSPGDYIMGWGDTFEAGIFPICRLTAHGHHDVVAKETTRDGALERVKQLASQAGTRAWAFVEGHTYCPIS